jgi:hypothetical protein
MPRDLTIKLPNPIMLTHLEYDRVNVLAEKVEEEPIADVALADDGVYTFLLHPPARGVASLRLRAPYLYRIRSTNALI